MVNNLEDNKANQTKSMNNTKPTHTKIDSNPIINSFFTWLTKKKKKKI